jgi:hypothetical protein
LFILRAQERPAADNLEIILNEFAPYVKFMSIRLALLWIGAVTLVCSTAIVASRKRKTLFGLPLYGCKPVQQNQNKLTKSRIVSYITEDTDRGLSMSSTKVCCIKMRFYDDVIRTGDRMRGTLKTFVPQ